MYMYVDNFFVRGRLVGKWITYVTHKSADNVVGYFWEPLFELQEKLLIVELTIRHAAFILR